ncbi:aegerolysin family protein [Kitasatospora sp. NPDC088134]|uniref:aegerolysin family protein n=1 Tax=Kitasatospora sp. NPDC088134 TaxID=3364071 RepID=UPI0038183C14
MTENTTLRRTARLAGTAAATLLMGATVLATAGSAQAATAEPPRELSSARSTAVSLVNTTKLNLQLAGTSLSHGCWDNNNNIPPSSIPYDHTSSWGSHSCGFMTGTQGEARYTGVNFQGSAVLNVTVAWNNPFSGSNTYSCTTSDPAHYKCATSGGSGNNASVTFTLSPTNGARTAALAAETPPVSRAASRSTRVNLINNSGQILGRTDAGLDHGIWTVRNTSTGAHTLMPPSLINPSGHAFWQSESDGFMTGTEGHASYVMAGVGTVSISWDNPFSGSNSYSCNAPTKHTCVRSGGSGDNATVTFTVN